MFNMVCQNKLYSACHYFQIFSSSLLLVSHNGFSCLCFTFVLLLFGLVFFSVWVTPIFQENYLFPPTFRAVLKSYSFGYAFSCTFAFLSNDHLFVQH